MMPETADRFHSGFAGSEGPQGFALRNNAPQGVVTSGSSMKLA
jgi:hypothetical protein